MNVQETSYVLIVTTPNSEHADEVTVLSASSKLNVIKMIYNQIYKRGDNLRGEYFEVEVYIDGLYAETLKIEDVINEGEK